MLSSDALVLLFHLVGAASMPIYFEFASCSFFGGCIGVSIDLLLACFLPLGLSRHVIVSWRGVNFVGMHSCIVMPLSRFLLIFVTSFQRLIKKICRSKSKPPLCEFQ